MLISYLRLIMRYWWLALLPVIVTAAIALRSYRPPEPAYQITQRYAVGLPPERTSGVYNYDRQYVWLSSEYMAAGLDNIIRTSTFAQRVADRLVASGLTIQAAQIQGALASDHKQSLLMVYLTWPDAAQSVQISDAIYAELREHGSSYWPQLTNADAAPVIALDKPVPVPVTAPLRDRFDFPVRILLSLAAGIALAFVAHSLDPFVRDRTELENLGMAIIGEIPVHRS